MFLEHTQYCILILMVLTKEKRFLENPKCVTSLSCRSKKPFAHTNVDGPLFCSQNLAGIFCKRVDFIETDFPLALLFTTRNKPYRNLVFAKTFLWVLTVFFSSIVVELFLVWNTTGQIQYVVTLKKTLWELKNWLNFHSLVCKLFYLP